MLIVMAPLMEWSFLPDESVVYFASVNGPQLRLFCIAKMTHLGKL
jgi:hypothetical protein